MKLALCILALFCSIASAQTVRFTDAQLRQMGYTIVESGSRDSEQQLLANGYRKIPCPGGWYWGRPGETPRQETESETIERFKREARASGWPVRSDAEYLADLRAAVKRRDEQLRQAGAQTQWGQRRQPDD